eukprot:4511943-Alexandrium_andersonii.AAC.1
MLDHQQRHLADLRPHHDREQPSPSCISRLPRAVSDQGGQGRCDGLPQEEQLPGRLSQQLRPRHQERTKLPAREGGMLRFLMKALGLTTPNLHFSHKFWELSAVMIEGTWAT